MAWRSKANSFARQKTTLFSNVELKDSASTSEEEVDSVAYCACSLSRARFFLLRFVFFLLLFATSQASCA
jgi:hypothetical protein